MTRFIPLVGILVSVLTAGCGRGPTPADISLPSTPAAAVPAPSVEAGKPGTPNGPPNADWYRPQKTESLQDLPYDRYVTTDRFGREITFYLSESGEARGPLPLVVYVHGSGCTSLFVGDKNRVSPTNGHITIQSVVEGKARLLIVEKPGVKFLDKPATPDAQAGSAEFRTEHTLGRWVEAVSAAIRAARQVPGISNDKALVIGHSEGGLVACCVARDMPEVVTHVASLAGGGPSQLFDLITLARKGAFFRDVSEEPEERVKFVLDQWPREHGETVLRLRLPAVGDVPGLVADAGAAREPSQNLFGAGRRGYCRRPLLLRRPRRAPAYFGTGDRVRQGCGCGPLVQPRGEASGEWVGRAHDANR
jgi:pimeloyl-ACP methyl ester carboxylesterase